MNLCNKVVIVTGGSSGIGAAIAKSFAKEAAKVVIVGRNETKLNNVATECEKLGSKPLVIIGDVSKEPDAKRVIDTTVKTFSQLDVLVNNAGIGGVAGIEDDNTMDVFDQVMATNLRAAVYLTHLASPYITESKGNIINISSIASYISAPSRSFSYCVSKAALDHFSRCIALELAPKGVRCNTVNPGPVQTDILVNSGFVDEAKQTAAWGSMKKLTALNRVGDPNEIADLVVFLASDKAKGITGASFVSDNGMMLKGPSN